ncbi:aminodeoxychorismate lyase [Teredinibacter sp. KSP-S5-2]|uniref:aminodeoxychorismate lyase n=1 Tax=Teredinibacter sp. KSP-S5-2 TaxID=3034506 RepID=UPI0029346AED|nr:aminodeoxychorismate lyase [Teredinibacter sp. KSP-S5-2]WNO10928.1 aminodeoxychorismate lyase [Teredinibacter sp. KSP-S5-2]
MNSPIISINGNISNFVEVEDRGFLYGDGVFETMRFQNGLIPLWQEHKSRLLASIRKLFIQFEETDIEAYLSEFISRLPSVNGVVKLVVTRGKGGKGFYPDKQPQPKIVLLFHERASVKSDVWFQSETELVMSEHRLSGNRYLAGLKHLNRLDYIVAAEKAQVSNQQELLLADTEEKIIESMHHNIFIAQKDRILTPTLDTCGVEGVLKRVLKSLVDDHDFISYSEQVLSFDDIVDADEVFLTNAVVGIVPVKSLLDSKQELHKTYAQYDVAFKLSQLLEKKIKI